MAELSDNQGQLVFGLDIGTRSIVGTVGFRRGEQFCVAAQRVKEHETRAMLDGQIHDIRKVGETIRQVKQQLEADTGRRLKDVCIAAAGRVLRTVTVYVEQEFDGEREITPEDVYTLATMGVEKAYEEFAKVNDTDMKFYCVGYTPMRYYMNGYQIGNPEGHKARKAGADMIATFLPDDVVDGLYKSVEEAGLQVVNLTLEPIAAIQVAIPEKFRMLNMALVDVGAGTSDISITKEGTITAYGMIPLAGDSLTEILVQHCLVDFDTAEQIKRQAGERETVEYADIMGLTQTISSQEVFALLEESVRKMTKMVADCIRELNGDKAVSAVFVVGGGGMIPGYTDRLAEELGIVKERVAVRGEEVLKNIVFEREDAVRSPLMVTPVGICLSYYEQSNNFIFVVFNERRIKLYDNGRLVVADAAMQAQFPNESLFPKRGEALEFTVNGKARMVRGQQGEAAVITLNGEPADIAARVHNGDRITVTPSTAGEAAVQELGQLPELARYLKTIVNGMTIELPRSATVNGKMENEFYSIQNGDDIWINNCYTVAQIAEFMDVPLRWDSEILVNDTPARKDTRVFEHFTVSWEADEEALTAAAGERETQKPVRDAETVSDGAENAPGEDSAGEAFGGMASAGEMPADEPDRDINSREKKSGEGAAGGDGRPESADGENAGSAGAGRGEGADGTHPEKASHGTEGFLPDGTRRMTITVNKMPLTLSGKSSYVFVDVFDYIDFDLSQPGGRNIVTSLNGRPAEYMEQIESGDVIDIYWDK